MTTNQTSMLRTLLAVVAGTVAAVAFAAAASANDAPPKNGNNKFGPGCEPERPAVGHHAGGVTAKLPPGKERKAPIPCLSKTAFRTGEISLVITNKDTLLFQPALATETTGLPIGVLRSTDQGANWTFIDPLGSPARVGSADSNMWVDHDTGRIFWSAPGPRIDHSDDDGRSWSPSGRIPLGLDHPQVFSGPPPENLKTSMQGYPNIVYVVVARASSLEGTHISRSLDGGLTWSQKIPLRFPQECPYPGNDPIGGYGLNGVVGRDGTIYVPFTPCQRPYVAISYDAGDTWDLSLVADTQTIGWGELGLGMDKQGNLYAAWTGHADRLPYLAISRDESRNWTAPLMIGAPGVNEAALPVLVAGKRGQVAVTYYGSKNSPRVTFPLTCLTGILGTPPAAWSLEAPSLGCPPYVNETWSTYVTETFDALDREPLFWSATLNDPRYPTWYGLTPSSFRVPGHLFTIGSDAQPVFSGPNGGGHVDYYSMTMGPGDTPWVGFFQECPFGLPVAGNPNCPSTLTGSQVDGLFGMVGRLVRVHGEDSEDDDDD